MFSPFERKAGMSLSNTSFEYAHGSLLEKKKFQAMIGRRSNMQFKR
jgi:hypothetical protein